MAIDWVRMKEEITLSAVRAVNGLLFKGEEKALKDVPVRKVFSGGRQTVRFKTAEEIEADKDLRARLGLAPEMLATPEAIARVRAAGRNPLKSLHSGGKEFGFARTIERPSSDPRRSTVGAIDQLGEYSPEWLRENVSSADMRRHLQGHGTGTTRAQRGLTENRPNRANTFMPTRGFADEADPRLVDTQVRDRNQLADRDHESRLTSRGRYELRSGRAIRDQTRVKLDISTGRIFAVQTEQERLGGGLKSTIRVEKATAAMYPVIEGWLLAGDADHRYAVHQELGNRHNPAHPFLRPRLPEWKLELIPALKRSFGRTGR